MTPPKIGEMTFGPYAITHHSGSTVMVPNAAPGDIVELEIAEQRRSHAIGRIVRIEHPAESRRDTPCAYLPRCGGCDWQHIQYSAQLRFKGELLSNLFHNTFKIDLEPDGLIEPSEREFGYRSRIRLKRGPGGTLGYHGASSNSLVEIDRCLIADESVRIPRQTVRALGRGCAEIELVAGNAGLVLIADLKKKPSDGEVRRVHRAALDEGVAGIILRSPAGRELVGDVRTRIEVEPGCVIEGAADIFTQVNRAQNSRLVAAVMRCAALSPGKPILDLFCGAGNFSLPACRRGARVVGVDAEPLAIEAARQNAANMRMDAQFVAMRAREMATFLGRAQYRPEVVIIDPPRTGARDLIEPIAKMRSPRVIYVSCDPPTMARDLRSLSDFGYRIADVRGFDLFPNTHHVEVVVGALLT